MGKLLLISEEDLRGLIREAVTNAVDNITKKIASQAAVRSYNNEIFRPRRRVVVESCGSSHVSYGCGSSGGGCGSVNTSRSYSSCGGGGGGCGSSSSRSSGGCGGGNTSGGC